VLITSRAIPRVGQEVSVTAERRRHFKARKRLDRAQLPLLVHSQRGRRDAGEALRVVVQELVGLRDPVLQVVPERAQGARRAVGLLAVRPHRPQQIRSARAATGRAWKNSLRFQ
jgi:hypothetical protein